MVIAQLTHLRIAMPSSGNPPGEVPNDCFPRIDDLGITKTPQAGFFCASVSDIHGGNRPSDNRPEYDADREPDRNDTTGYGGTEDTGNSSGIDCAASWVSAVSMATGRLG